MVLALNGAGSEMTAVFIIQQWAHNLIRVQPTVEWIDEDGNHQEYHRIYYLHQEGLREH